MGSERGAELLAEVPHDADAEDDERLASFPARLAALVNGGSVTVNGVTYTNPTQITVNLTVSSGAE